MRPSPSTIIAPESPGTCMENFSTPGDSGAFVVVGLGHIGDLLSTGGSGVTASTSIVTYVTPIDFLLKSIEDWVGVDVGVPGPTRYLNAHPQPGLGAVAMLARSELRYGERWSRPVAVALCFLT